MLKSEAKAASKVCGEAGRALFHQEIGQYFIGETKFKPMPAGTACPNCGATDVPLWKNASNNIVCAPQIAITSKRPGREKADQPCLPPPAGTDGMVSFAEGAIAIAGPGWGKAITRLLPQVPVPPSLQVIFPEGGDRNKVLAQLLRDPPAPPFVVIIFGKKGEFVAELTVDVGSLVINGPEGAGGYRIDRNAALALLALCGQLKWEELEKISAARLRMLANANTEADRKIIDGLPGRLPTGVTVSTLFRLLPSPGTPQYTALRILLTSETSTTSKPTF